MKPLPVLSLALLALGCQETGSPSPPAMDLSEVHFEVPNMVCEFSCVPMVEKILAEQPGVKQVDVDLETKTATVLVDEKQFDADAAVAALVDVQFIDTRVKSPASNPPAETATASVAQNTSG